MYVFKRYIYIFYPRISIIMEYIAKCINGLESIAELEIKDLCSAPCKKLSPGLLKFSTNNIDRLLKFCRSLITVYEFKKSFTFSSLNEITLNLPEIKINGTFKVKCFKNLNFSSQEVEKKVGEFYYNKGNKVNLDNADNVIIVDIIENLCIIGVAIVRKNLTKRAYKLRVHNQSLNASIAYGMVRFSGWNKSQILVDPFAKDGTLVIEAASFALSLPREIEGDYFDKDNNSNLQIYAYDNNLHNIQNCKVNSKLANINDKIKFSKIDISWLDVKFNENEVDHIITSPPLFSSHNDATNVYKELFDKANIVLKRNGKLTILTNKSLDFITNLKLDDHFVIEHGENTYYILKYSKI
ncbi:hypothetical protein D6777_04540 [Candidatus Woesearchaeota archaeon]|nr:MAG: hypothetical protein D6777_04540 [Candidatus Woesearchaeota archaeon]